MPDAAGSSQKSVFSPHYVRFRERLVVTRKENGRTQHDVARALGRPQSFVAKVENGERRLDIVELISYARAIGVDPRKFIASVVDEIAG